mgnify:CR=1 FL=1
MGSERRQHQRDRDIFDSDAMTVPLEGNTENRGTPTTRCYPRTLAEAFPHSTERAQWFFPPEREMTWSSLFTWLAAFVLWGFLFYILI